jgi:hypothetical protein
VQGALRFWKGDTILKSRPLGYITLIWGVLLILSGCQSDTSGPTELLNKFFSSAAKQDYATTYTCYYDAYKAKVSKEEFIRHRKEASVLLSYKINSVKLPTGDTAEAEVQLTFGPSEKLKRTGPVTVNLKEELIKEKGEWKIKVW